jgi:hypothetical protein
MPSQVHAAITTSINTLHTTSVPKTHPMQDQISRFLKQEKENLPFLAKFWDIASGPPVSQSLSTISILHQTGHYPVHTFYKPISLHLNLANYD